MYETDPSQHEIDQSEFTAQERSLAEWMNPDEVVLEGLAGALEPPEGRLKLKDRVEDGWEPTGGVGWPE